MNKIVTIAGLAVMAGGAFAQSNQGSWPTDWSANGEAQWRTSQVLSGGEQNQLWSCLRVMPGDEQYVILRAMNKAAADNGMNWNMNGTAMKSTGTTIDAARSGDMMDSNWYAMSYMDRCKHDITDNAVWDLLVKNTPDGDRGVLGTTWWKLTDDAQHAIIKTVKRSWAEMPPTSDQMRWYK